MSESRGLGCPDSVPQRRCGSSLRHGARRGAPPVPRGLAVIRGAPTSCASPACAALRDAAGFAHDARAQPARLARRRPGHTNDRVAHGDACDDVQRRVRGAVRRGGLEPRRLDRGAAQVGDCRTSRRKRRRTALRLLPTGVLAAAADWLQGPCFYGVCASVFNGQPASLSLVSKLFTGPARRLSAIRRPHHRQPGAQGRHARVRSLLHDRRLTTRALLWVLLLGRLAGGIGSLLFSAPEASPADLTPALTPTPTRPQRQP